MSVIDTITKYHEKIMYLESRIFPTIRPNANQILFYYLRKKRDLQKEFKVGCVDVDDSITVYYYKALEDLAIETINITKLDPVSDLVLRVFDTFEDIKKNIENSLKNKGFNKYEMGGLQAGYIEDNYKCGIKKGCFGFYREYIAKLWDSLIFLEKKEI